MAARWIMSPGYVWMMNDEMRRLPDVQMSGCPCPLFPFSFPFPLASELVMSAQMIECRIPMIEGDERWPTQMFGGGLLCLGKVFLGIKVRQGCNDVKPIWDKVIEEWLEDGVLELTYSREGDEWERDVDMAGRREEWTIRWWYWSNGKNDVWFLKPENRLEATKVSPGGCRTCQENLLSKGDGIGQCNRGSNVPGRGGVLTEGIAW